MNKWKDLRLRKSHSCKNWWLFPHCLLILNRCRRGDGVAVLAYIGVLDHKSRTNELDMQALILKQQLLEKIVSIQLIIQPEPQPL